MSETGDALAPDSQQQALALEDPGIREFLGFELDDERYALPLSTVREIVRLPPVTEVPRSPAEIMGVISVRGTVTTLIDLRRKLRMPERPVGPLTRVLLVDRGNEIIGLLVDAVLQVYRLREDEVELASVLGSEASAYVMGIGRPGTSSVSSERGSDGSGDDILILLDPLGLLKVYG